MIIERLLRSALLCAFIASPALAADPENGADLFDTHCSDCHSASPKAISRKGPTLFKVVGRHAGAIPGFRYSAAMLKSGIVWTPQRLDAYLTSPKTVVPGGIMKFKGLSRPTDRADIIAYLQK